MASNLREVVDEVIEAFTGVFPLEPDPELDPERNVDKVVHETGIVAGLVASIQPLPAPDFVLLTPLHAKMALQVGRIKGFEITQERASEMVREVMATVWLALTSQALIGIVGKIIPFARIFLTYPLNYGATWAIGKVIAYYFDCLDAGQVPTPEEMRRIFREQLRVGRKQGEKHDGDSLLERAQALRDRIAARDPSLRTKTRIEPRFRTIPKPPPAPATPPPPPGERREIKIVLGKKRDEPPAPVAEPPDAEPPDAERPGAEPPSEASEGEASSAKTIGPQDDRREIEIGFKAAAKTLGDAQPGRVEDETAEVETAAVETAEDETAEDETAEDETSADETAVRALGEDEASTGGAAAVRASSMDEPAPAAEEDGDEEQLSLVDQLERLAKLRDQGVLDDDEFQRAKAKLLAD